jgi:hypothetical protein
MRPLKRIKTAQYIFRGIELPDALKESIDAYVETGRPTGSFLAACIDNKLGMAISLADSDSLKALPAIVGYLYNECPGDCWGSRERRTEWMEARFQERQRAAV